MAIALLTTISASKFAGGANLAVAQAGGTSLGTNLTAAATKINEIIGDLNNGELDVLDVGSGLAGYYAGNDSWLAIDGTNPPTCSAIRMIDRTTGNFGTVVLDAGVLTVI